MDSKGFSLIFILKKHNYLLNYFWKYYYNFLFIFRDPDYNIYRIYIYNCGISIGFQELIFQENFYYDTQNNGTTNIISAYNLNFN